jgi:hypothetical protein
LILSNQDIVDLLQQYDDESKAIRKEALKLSWYMRGGISYNQALSLSREERELVGNIIEENLKTTEKSGLPFF